MAFLSSFLSLFIPSMSGHRKEQKICRDDCDICWRDWEVPPSMKKRKYLFSLLVYGRFTLFLFSLPPTSAEKDVSHPLH